MTPSAHSTFRWEIGFLLCMASALNYIYRSTLAMLAPPIKEDLKWSDVEDGDITALFVLSYTLMYATSRRIIVRIGTRKRLWVNQLQSGSQQVTPAELNFLC